MLNTELEQQPQSIARDLLVGRSAQERAPRVPGTTSFRTVWISDIHLGSSHCQASALSSCLGAIETDTLFLVGDIIDEWKLRRKHLWPQEHDAVLEEFARRAASGTRVVYVPGNHDESLRAFDGAEFHGVECTFECVHETADGRRLLVMHGDRFDDFSSESSRLARFGDWAYCAALWINTTYNNVGARIGARPRYVSLKLKQIVKQAVSYIDDFERCLLDEATRRNLDGVVCGHIHKAELRSLDGVLYCNDGDWVESCTLLAEHFDGSLEVLRWREGRLVPTHRVPPKGCEEGERGDVQDELCRV